MVSAAPAGYPELPPAPTPLSAAERRRIGYLLGGEGEARAALEILRAHGDLRSGPPPTKGWWLPGANKLANCRARRLPKPCHRGPE